MTEINLSDLSNYIGTTILLVKENNSDNFILNRINGHDIFLKKRRGNYWYYFEINTEGYKIYIA